MCEEEEAVGDDGKVLALPMEMWVHIIQRIRIGSNEFKKLRLVCLLFAFEGMRHAVQNGQLVIPSLIRWESFNDHYSFLSNIHIRVDSDMLAFKVIKSCGTDISLVNHDVALSSSTQRLRGLRITDTTSSLPVFCRRFDAMSSTLEAASMKLSNCQLDLGWIQIRNNNDVHTFMSTFGSETSILRGLKVQLTSWPISRNILSLSSSPPTDGLPSLISGLSLSLSHNSNSGFYPTPLELEWLRPLDVFVLKRCAHLRNVRPFSRIRDLTFDNCPNLEDVSSLSNVRRLSLHGCKGVWNVSMLGRVEYLDLSGTGVRNVLELGNVIHLNLSETAVRNVNTLGNVRHLNLNNCEQVSDTAALGKCEWLDLRKTSVTDFSSLYNVVTLLRNDFIPGE